MLILKKHHLRLDLSAAPHVASVALTGDKTGGFHLGRLDQPTDLAIVPRRQQTRHCYDLRTTNAAGVSSVEFGVGRRPCS